MDDDKDTRDVMVRLLELAGYAAESAGDYASALERAKQKQFDVLIADVGLPDGNGLRLLSELRGLYPIRGVVLSGYGMASDIQKSVAAGFGRHLTKPVTVLALREAIQDVCRDKYADTQQPDLSSLYYG